MQSTLNQLALSCSAFWQFNKCCCVFDVEDKPWFSKNNAEMMCFAYFVELGSGVVLEETQTLAVQPPVMSLPLLKGENEHRVSPNGRTHMTYQYYSTSKFVSWGKYLLCWIQHMWTALEKEFSPAYRLSTAHFRLGSSVGLLGLSLLPGCPCSYNEPSSPPSPQWNSASWCVWWTGPPASEGCCC